MQSIAASVRTFKIVTMYMSWKRVLHIARGYGMVAQFSEYGRHDSEVTMMMTK